MKKESESLKNLITSHHHLDHLCETFNDIRTKLEVVLTKEDNVEEEEEEVKRSEIIVTDGHLCLPPSTVRRTTVTFFSETSFIKKRRKNCFFVLPVCVLVTHLPHILPSSKLLTQQHSHHPYTYIFRLYSKIHKRINFQTENPIQNRNMVKRNIFYSKTLNI